MKPKKYRAPLVNGKRKTGRPTKAEREAYLRSAGAKPSPSPSSPTTTTTTTTTATKKKPKTISPGSDDGTEELKRALGALEDPLERKAGGGEADASGHAPGSTTQGEEPPPLLSPDELVMIAEAISGAGLLLFAVFAKRQLPTEQQTAFRESTRKLLLVSAPGTLEAAGAALQENRELLRLLSPLGFGAGLVTHLVQRARELQPVREERKVKPERVPPPAPGVPPAPTLTPENTGKFDPPAGLQLASRKMPKIRTWSGDGPPPWGDKDATE